MGRHKKPKKSKPILYFNDLFNYYTKNTIKDLVLPKEQCKNILKKLSSKIINKVFDAEEVKLPIIGSIRVKKIKHYFEHNKLKINWAETKKANKVVYHTNDHRDGYFYRIIWRRNNRVKGINIYSFTPERYNVKRKLSKILKTDFTKDFFMD
jgi:nucleoid DNA-binding protein